MVKKREKLVIFLTITFIGVIIDILSKRIIQSTTDIKITDFLNITYIKNFGAGFGIFQNQRIFLILFSLIFVLIIFYYYSKIPNNMWFIAGIALIFSGAIGNLIDRIFYGYVIDFIDLSFWPAFNVADSMISIGALIIVILLLKNKDIKK